MKLSKQLNRLFVAILILLLEDLYEEKNFNNF